MGSRAGRKKERYARGMLDSRYSAHVQKVCAQNKKHVKKYENIKNKVEKKKYALEYSA